MQRKIRKMQQNVKISFSIFLNRVAWTMKIGFTLFVVFFIVLILIIKPLNNNNRELSGPFKDEAVSAEMSKEEFITQLTPHAQEVASTYGVRPSLLIAQAALESNWGNSTLSKESNNYFGIKNPAGKQYATREFRESGWSEEDASFKQYESPYESVLDYANLLKNGTSWNENLYREVIEASNYKDAAIAVGEAGYATDPEYAQKVIRIIEQYQLNELDN